MWYGAMCVAVCMLVCSLGCWLVIMLLVVAFRKNCAKKGRKEVNLGYEVV